MAEEKSAKETWHETRVTPSTLTAESTTDAAKAARAELVSLASRDAEIQAKIVGLIKEHGYNAAVVLAAYKEQEENLKRIKELTHSIAGIFKDELNTEIGKTVSGIKDAVTELPKVEKALEAIAAAIPGGAAVKFLTDMLVVAGNATWGWYQHLGEVNRQLYDINASLGNMGSKGQLFENSITNVTKTLNISVDDARKLAGAMASTGIEYGTIQNHLDEIVALSKLWSEVSPEDQVKLMSDYIKEFGYNGEKAWATMFTLYTTTQDLKKDLPNLDIGKFVSQTHEVALGMRKYGLEASDALAITSTLARMGIEQARISGLAAQLGETGLGAAGTVGYLAMHKMRPAYQAELARLEETQKALPKGAELSPEQTERMDYLRKTLEKTKGGEVTATMGTFLSLEANERMKFQMGMFDEMIKKATGGFGIQGGRQATGEQLVGALTQIEMPGIGKMDIAQAEAFAKGIEELKKDPKINTLEKAFQEQYKATLASTAAAQKTADDQRKAAQDAADATIKSKDRLDQIGGLLGQWFTKQFGERAFTPTQLSAAGQAVQTEAKTKRRALTDEEIMETIGMRGGSLEETGSAEFLRGQAGAGAKLGEQAWASKVTSPTLRMQGEIRQQRIEAAERMASSPGKELEIAQMQQKNEELKLAALKYQTERTTGTNITIDFTEDARGILIRAIQSKDTTIG